MCLILDQFLWGHSSRVCDISCLFFTCLKKNKSLIRVLLYEQSGLGLIFWHTIFSVKIQSSHWDFENRIHRIHPWKKLVKIEKLEFDLERLEFLVLAEI